VFAIVDLEVTIIVIASSKISSISERLPHSFASSSLVCSSCKVSDISVFMEVIFLVDDVAILSFSCNACYNTHTKKRQLTSLA
jgi:hypothetical protein